MEELTQDQIAAELAAGYNDEDAVQDTVQDEVAEVEEQREEVVEEKQEDPWAGVPAALKAEFEALKSKASQMDTLAERLKQAERRVGGLANKLHEAEVAAKNAPTKEQIEAAAKDKEKMDALKDEWPEWADALEKTEQRITEKLAGSVDIGAVRAELETNFSQKLNAQQAQFEDRLVNVVHRGWRETVKTDDFKNWFSAQDPETQALGNSERAEDAITILDAFKDREKEKPSIKDERTRRLESASRAPKTTSTSRPKSTANMSDAERRAYDIAAGYNDE